MIVPVAMAILDTEDAENEEWVLQQLIEAGQVHEGSGFYEWFVENEMAHFSDRGAGHRRIEAVLPTHQRMYVR